MSSITKTLALIWTLLLSACSDGDAEHKEKDTMGVTPISAPITSKPEGCENLVPAQTAKAHNAEGYWQLYVTYRSCEHEKEDWLPFIDEAARLGSDKAMYAKAIIILTEHPESQYAIDLLRQSSRLGNEEAKRSLKIRNIG